MLAIMAGAIPGVGSLERGQLASWLTHLGERPAGPIASLVGEQQARRASPTILDLAASPEERVSLVVFGGRGLAKETLDELSSVAYLLRGDTSSGGEGEAIEGAERATLSARYMRVAEPVARSVLRAEDALYGHPLPQPSVDYAGLARQLLDPWRLVLVALGSPDLVSLVTHATPAFAWDDTGVLLREGEVPRCGSP